MTYTVFASTKYTVLKFPIRKRYMGGLPLPLMISISQPARGLNGSSPAQNGCIRRKRFWMLQEIAIAAASRGIRCGRTHDAWVAGSHEMLPGMQAFRHQYLDMRKRCSFHTTNRITNRAMRILRAKRYSFAPAILKPVRKSPLIPTVEMASPFEKYVLCIEKSFSIFSCTHCVLHHREQIPRIPTEPNASAFVSWTQVGPTPEEQWLVRSLGLRSIEIANLFDRPAYLLAWSSRSGRDTACSAGGLLDSG
jgi:hypothetical protein